MLNHIDRLINGAGVVFLGLSAVVIVGGILLLCMVAPLLGFSIIGLTALSYIIGGMERFK